MENRRKRPRVEDTQSQTQTQSQSQSQLENAKQWEKTKDEVKQQLKDICKQ